jgi:ubiquinone/menaquinone biosynthesis C-methylase UbiE
LGHNLYDKIKENKEEKGKESMSETKQTGDLWQAAEAAESWGRLTEQRERLMGTATQQMIEAAQLRSGDQVLDIASGTGDQSRLAARLVGPEGSVLATDISQQMLLVAARLAQQEGLKNITTRIMNAEQLDLPDNSYDAVISRLGLMLIPKRQQALTEIQRVLKPGGRIAAIVWSKPERNPLFALYINLVNLVAKSRGQESDGKRPDPFSLADTTLFTSALTEAGFQDVQVQTVALTFQFSSFEDVTTWWGHQFDLVMAKLEPHIMEEVRQAVHQFEGPQGIVAPAELILAVGMK